MPVGMKFIPLRALPRPTRICRTCGIPLKRVRSYCASCDVAILKEGLIEAAKLGRIATHSAKAEARRSDTLRRQVAARKAWNSADKPDWLDAKTYREQIRPRLAGITVPIRRGVYVAPLARNTAAFLNGSASRLHWYQRPLAEIGTFWRERPL
jgi:hypothetical protein